MDLSEVCSRPPSPPGAPGRGRTGYNRKGQSSSVAAPLTPALRRPVTLGLSSLPSFSFDAPLEANRVSSEGTQAQLDEFRQMPWIKPDYKAATLDALRKIERY